MCRGKINGKQEWERKTPYKNADTRKLTKPINVIVIYIFVIELSMVQCTYLIIVCLSCFKQLLPSYIHYVIC